MSLETVVHDNAGKLGTVAGSIGASAVFIFKQWREDRKEDKDFDSREKIFYELINILKKDIEVRNQTDQYILQILRDNATSLAKLAEGLTALVHKG